MQLIDAKNMNKDPFFIDRYCDYKVVFKTRAGQPVIDFKSIDGGKEFMAKIKTANGDYEWRKYDIRGKCLACSDECEHDIVILTKS